MGLLDFRQWRSHLLQRALPYYFVPLALTFIGMTGTVGPFYQPAMLLTQAGIVPGHDMTSEAALTKLSYLLGHASLSTDDVAKQMSVSIRGELTAQSAMTFQHPVVQLSGHLADLTALGYAISSGDVVEVQRILKGQVEWLLGEADYSGNSPLVRRLCPKTFLR